MIKPQTAFIIIAVLAALLVAGVASCRYQRERAKEAEAQEQLAEGRTQSATEAIREINELGQRDQISDEQVKQAQDAVLNAPPSQRDDIARYELCRLQQRPDCQRVQ